MSNNHLGKVVGVMRTCMTVLACVTASVKQLDHLS
jgi:hypothetical protein